VEQASEYLVSSSSKKFFRHLGTLGGILLGAAISNLLAMTIANQYTAAGTILSASFGIVGAFMIALHIAKD
jgi:formate-dependent nitrite reductase membrane component NrfD